MAGYGSYAGGSGDISTHTSSSSTTSTPVAIDTPENQLEMSIATLAAQLGQQVFNWAQGVFAKTSAITDQMVNNFIKSSQYAASLAASQLNEYFNVGMPELNQLAALAGQYNSKARQQYNMGAAEETAGQAGAANLANTTAELRGRGVNPGSGNYADVLAAQNTAIGASEAGAGNQASVNTAATGRELLGQSIAAQQQLPGDVVNALNSAYQGISGAENSVLSNANVGATLQDTSAPFFSAAMQLKNPPTGQNLKSASVSGGGGGGGNKKGGGYQQQPFVPGSNIGKMGSRYGPLTQPGLATNIHAGPPIQNANSGNGGGNGGIYGPQYSGMLQVPGAESFNFGNPATAAADQSGAGFSEFGGQPGTNLGSDPWSQMFQQVGPTSNFSAGGNYFTPAPPATTPGNFGAWSGDVSSPFGAWAGGDAGNSTANWGDIPGLGTSGSGVSDAGGAVNPSAGGSGGGYSPSSVQQPSGGGYQPNMFNQGGYNQTAPSGGYTSGGVYGGGGGGYARGGVVHGPRAVPPSASPSGGQRTDDVHARLNADEFVIPKDVAMWKGQEFFQKLIAGSRKARLMGPAQGKPASPPQGPVRFSTVGVH